MTKKSHDSQPNAGGFSYNHQANIRRHNRLPVARIALTGGPSGGKTTVLDHLKINLEHRTVFAPEAATMVLADMGTRGLHPKDWTADERVTVQQQILAKQIELETAAEAEAKQKPDDEWQPRTMVTDRGLADGAAYLPGGMDQLADMAGMTREDILGRYALVIHLTTSAKQPRGYDKHSNAYRSEDADLARQLDDHTLAAWDGHPNRVILGIDNPDRLRWMVHAIIDSAIIG